MVFSFTVRLSQIVSGKGVVPKKGERMKRWMVFAVLGTLSLAAFADSVQTVDGQTLEGLRVTGLPSEVVLLDGGVEITIDAAQLATITFSGGIVLARMTTGRELSGSLATDIQSIYLRTETGEVEIPFGQVAGVAFTRKASKEGDYSASITLADGRAFDGDLARSFPSEISLDLNGIVTTTRLSTITALTFGETTILETSSGTLSGRLATTIPESIVMGTDFGSYAIPASQAAEIRISKPRAYVARQSVSSASNSVGVGLKIWGGVPTAIGNLTWGNLGLELGAGLRTASAFEGYVNATAVFYFASARYLVSMPFIGDVLRPYFGGGAVGATIFGSVLGVPYDVSLLAVDAFGGVELSLAALQIPVTLFVAADWAPLFGDSSAAFVTQFGARVDFRF